MSARGAGYGGSRLLAAVFLALAASVLLLSCKREPAPAPAQSAAVNRTPPPPPAGWLGDLVVHKPSQTWRALRALGGRSGQLLPTNVELLLSSVLGLPSLAADSIDGELPAFGCLVQDDRAALHVVFAVHVSHGGELAAKLSTGNTPSFRAAPPDPQGLSVFAPTAPDKQGFALGLIDNYLIVARESKALALAGAYLARSLPQKPLPAEPITLVLPKSALAGPLAGSLRKAWQERRGELLAADRKARAARGRAPDFADPAAIILGADAVMETAFSVLESLESVKVSVEPRADRLSLRIDWAPSPNGAAEALNREMTVGDLDPLRKLPASTAAALLLRSEPPANEAAGRAADGWLELFGARLGPADSQRVQDVFTNWERARGGTTTYAAFAGPLPSIGFWGELRDAERFRKSARGLVELLKLPSVSAPIREFAGIPRVSLSAVPGSELGHPADRALVSLTRSEPAKSPVLIPEKIEIVWLAADGQAHAAAGSSGLGALKELIGAARGERPNLSQDGWLEAARKSAGSRVAAGLWVDLGAVSVLAGQAGRAPVLALLGKDAQGAWVSVDASGPALEIVAQASLGR